MSLDIEEIRARLDATTNEPWTVAAEIDGVRAGRNTVVHAHGKRVVTVGQTRPHHDREAEANVAFIATARQDVPALLAEIERLREDLADAQTARLVTEKDRDRLLGTVRSQYREIERLRAARNDERSTDV
jgi:hypothetical protein